MYEVWNLTAEQFVDHNNLTTSFPCKLGQQVNRWCLIVRGSVALFYTVCLEILTISWIISLQTMVVLRTIVLVLWMISVHWKIPLWLQFIFKAVHSTWILMFDSIKEYPIMSVEDILIDLPLISIFCIIISKWCP